MADVAGFPYFEVQFNKAGALHEEAEVAALLGFLDRNEVTDLFVLSHGWNNHMDEARELYRTLLLSIAVQLRANPTLGTRKFAVLGLFWPSKKFADKSLISGGAASGGGLADALLTSQLERLKGGFDNPRADIALEQAKGLLDRLDSSAQARRQYVDLIRSLVPRDEGQPDVDDADSFFTEDGDDLINRLSRPVPRAVSAGGTDEGGATAASEEGSAAGLIDSLGGIKDGALNLLNYATYYQMKERAGLVGRDGLNPLLGRLRSRFPALKLHLVGHSFGGRLVTAAAAGKETDPSQPVADTMTLLQAAFSHNGFAQHFDGDRDGFFRSVVTNGKVAGPILITCTENDQAVGKLYPLASMFAGQDAAGIGGPASRFGGIGCNGAQHTPEATVAKLLDVSGRYEGPDALRAGKLHNLNADEFIKDHSDVCGRQVAHAVLAAVALT
jgi:hypothetical protein